LEPTEPRRADAPGMITPMGRMMAGMPTALAEFEREIIREQVRSGRQGKAPAG
jgi:DNA invertase Pin-like site-specific DNA recombinase